VDEPMTTTDGFGLKFAQLNMFRIYPIGCHDPLHESMPNGIDV